MSPLFIKIYKDLTKCPMCKASPEEGYRCCQKCVKKAKLRFRVWTTERRTRGLCCYCDSPALNGWLRCEIHTLKNRDNCRQWLKDHPEYPRSIWIKRKSYREKGVCGNCPQHRPIKDGKVKCQTCTLRAWLRDKGIKTDKNTTGLTVRRLVRETKKIKKSKEAK